MKKLFLSLIFIFFIACGSPHDLKCDLIVDCFIISWYQENDNIYLTHHISNSGEQPYDAAFLFLTFTFTDREPYTWPFGIKIIETFSEETLTQILVLPYSGKVSQITIKKLLVFGNPDACTEFD